jgi:hypothetical protein
MTVVRKIKCISDNKTINSVTIDGYINVILLKNSETFRYINGKKKNKIVVAQFLYSDKIVSQAFYECSEKFKGTWLPFDGIKCDVGEKNIFFKYIDDSAFNSDLYPFGDLSLMAVSYVLGGGVWGRLDSKYKDLLRVEERTSLLELNDVVDISFEDSLIINHYINYSISRNYYTGNPVKNFRPKSPQWIKASKKIKNVQKLFSAFDFSNKMNNSNQIEYTPPQRPNYNQRSDYDVFYKAVDLSEINIEKGSFPFPCIIL